MLLCKFIPEVQIERKKEIIACKVNATYPKSSHFCQFSCSISVKDRWQSQKIYKASTNKTLRRKEVTKSNYLLQPIVIYSIPTTETLTQKPKKDHQMIRKTKKPSIRPTISVRLGKPITQKEKRKKKKNFFLFC